MTRQKYREIRKEIRLSIPIGEWQANTLRELRDKYANSDEKPLLVPAKLFPKLKSKITGRQVGEYWVRRDGHPKHYFAFIVLKDFNIATGSQGGFNPGSGPKVRLPLHRLLNRPVSFKPNVFLEQRAEALEAALECKWRTRNERNSDLLLEGVDLLEKGISYKEMPAVEGEEARCTPTSSIRFEKRHWERLLKEHLRPGEEQGDFIRRVFWIGLQSLEEKMNAGKRNS